jgi:3-oxoacyl-[acyl-carrier protein] reductase
MRGVSQIASRQEVVKTFGRLDVPINNAGAFIKRTPVVEYTDEYVKAVPCT